MPAGMVRPRASQVPSALTAVRDVPCGVWLGASAALGRPVPASEPYPHVCGGRVGRLRLSRRDCAACLIERQTPPAPGPLDAAALAALPPAPRGPQDRAAGDLED